MLGNAQSQLVSQTSPQIGDRMFAVFFLGQRAEKLHARAHPIVGGQGIQELQKPTHAVDRLVLRFDGLTIDPHLREVRVRDQLVELTSTEFKLLLELASNPGSRSRGND
nr:hypothetical protein [Mycobacterium tuberculosis]